MFAAVFPGPSESCDPGSELYVLDGEGGTPETGNHAELRVIAGGALWIYGGSSGWFVDGPGRRPVRFGRARPDVVLGTR